MKEKKLLHAEEVVAEKKKKALISPLKHDLKSPIAPLAIKADRFTYTFILNSEVVSIYYDKIRGEIFLRGHNIKNLELKPEEIEALINVQRVISLDEEGKKLAQDYKATLDMLLADN